MCMFRVNRAAIWFTKLVIYTIEHEPAASKRLMSDSYGHGYRVNKVGA